MKKNLLFSFILLVIWSYPMFGQDITAMNRAVENFGSAMRLVRSAIDKENLAASNSYVEGSQYLDTNFVEGDLLTKDSMYFTGILMRFDAYLENIEVKLQDGKVYNLADPGMIRQIRLKKDSLVNTKYISPLGAKSGFLFVLHEGKCCLYRRYYKIIKEKTPSNGIIGEIPARFIDKPKEYYIKLKDGVPQLCKTKKDLLEILKSHLSEIEMFMKKGKLKMNNEADLIRIIAYFDSLY